MDEIMKDEKAPEEFCGFIKLLWRKVNGADYFFLITKTAPAHSRTSIARRMSRAGCT
jgi:hypothetical protein